MTGEIVLTEVAPNPIAVQFAVTEIWQNKSNKYKPAPQNVTDEKELRSLVKEVLEDVASKFGQEIWDEKVGRSTEEVKLPDLASTIRKLS